MGKLKLGRSNGCWIDIFDAEYLQGHTRRLHGPADFPGLRIRENGWGESIESLVVGPVAYVQCFDSHNFDDTVFWLLPNQRLETLADLDLNAPIDSIRLYDRPPFAQEPAYAAYMLWAASQLAKLNAPRDRSSPRQFSMRHAGAVYVNPRGESAGNAQPGREQA